MPTSSVAVCSLALVILGVGAAQAVAQGTNGTAFNPHSGVDQPGGLATTTPPAPVTAPPVRSATIALPVAPLVSPILPNSSVATTIAFASQSAALSDEAKVDLDRLTKNLGDRRPRLIEIRAYAGGGGPDSRKVSAARAQAVRSYLIDRGLKTRIEAGAFGGDSRGGGSERVDILVPNS